MTATSVSTPPAGTLPPPAPSEPVPYSRENLLAFLKDGDKSEAAMYAHFGAKPDGQSGSKIFFDLLALSRLEKIYWWPNRGKLGLWPATKAAEA